MSRHDETERERLARELDRAREELGEAREQAAVLRGQLQGQRTAGETIAVQLAERAAQVGADLGRVQAGAARARTDAVTMRHLIAAHVLALQTGAGPELAARGLLDQLMVRGIDLSAETAQAQARAEAAAPAAGAAPAARIPAAVPHPAPAAAGSGAGTRDRPAP
ncbi:hypothetical protein [Actinacidiphila sp. ITFR-21]|uniref:hypothetical protein n=1 Tax=Actinacidiphila sp. ITFR-21 TaxID=3075199 RepID=UPI002889C902|nr:hypothetical protein [Streptomyces sp. ITFR-21]WNI16644.1 hypothetical protein RLT57_14730 [Streptomyces sp. ITFR-21]